MYQCHEVRQVSCNPYTKSKKYSLHKKIKKCLSDIFLDQPVAIPRRVLGNQAPLIACKFLSRLQHAEDRNVHRLSCGSVPGGLDGINVPIYNQYIQCLNVLVYIWHYFLIFDLKDNLTKPITPINIMLFPRELYIRTQYIFNICTAIKICIS